MHKFDPQQADKLDSPERHKMLPAKDILQRSGVTEGMLAAEIGCGAGFFTIPAAEILGDEGKIYAFDIEKVMLTYLRMKIDKPNIVPIQISGNKLPLKDKLLDFVLAAFVLHEAEEFSPLLKETLRVVKNSGIITIIEWIKQQEGEGPPINDRIDQDEILAFLKKESVEVEISEKLNQSHYIIMGRLNR